MLIKSTVAALSAAFFGSALGLPEDWASLRTSFAIAGAIGGLVSWAFEERPPITRRMIAVIAGAAAGFYGTPIVIGSLELTPETGEGLSFWLGLVALPLLAGVYIVAKRFQERPIETINKLRGQHDKGDKDA